MAPAPSPDEMQLHGLEVRRVGGFAGWSNTDARCEFISPAHLYTV